MDSLCLFKFSRADLWVSKWDWWYFELLLVERDIVCYVDSLCENVKCTKNWSQGNKVKENMPFFSCPHKCVTTEYYLHQGADNDRKFKFRNLNFRSYMLCSNNYVSHLTKSNLISFFNKMLMSWFLVWMSHKNIS